MKTGNMMNGPYLIFSLYSIVDRLLFKSKGKMISINVCFLIISPMKDGMSIRKQSKDDEKEITL